MKIIIFGKMLFKSFFPPNLLGSAKGGKFGGKEERIFAAGAKMSVF